ncbi:hypothetical protein MRY82_08680 [bacterium]|nr:hypothetical protein [bacterium]
MSKMRLVCLWIFLLLKPAQAYPDKLHYELNFSHQSSILIASDKANPRYGFVFSTTSNVLSVVDLFSRTLVKTIITPGFTVSACLLTEEEKIYFITDQSDQWSVLDLSQNIESPNLSNVDSDTNGVDFESIDCLHSLGNSHLVLGDYNTGTLYTYNLDDNSLDQQLNIGFTPVDTEVIEERNQVLVLGESGELEAYQVPSLQRLGNRVELSNYSSSNNFLQLTQSSFENSSYIFISNPISSASEIFAVQADHQNYLLSMIDFTSGGGIDPILTDTLIGNIYCAVTQRPESFSSAKIYVYAEDLSNSRLKIIDPNVSAAPSSWQEINHIDGVTNMTAKGNFIDEYNNLYILNDSTNTLKVFSDLPSIDLIGANLEITNESDYSFSVQSDASGLLKIKLMDATKQAVSPQAIKTYSSSSITANQNKSVSINTDDFIEGDNLLGVYVESGSTESYRGIEIFKDTIPPYPNDYKLKFGNQKLFVSWDGVNQADIDYYEISFGLDDQASDGAGITSPVLVNHTGTGDYTYNITGLVNGQRIYVKIKTVDQQGNESDYSPILSEVPEETIGLIALTGETGCQADSKVSGMILMMLMLLILYSRKKWQRK